MKVVFPIENILVSFTFWIETLGAAAINHRKIQFIWNICIFANVNRIESILYNQVIYGSLHIYIPIGIYCDVNY